MFASEIVFSVQPARTVTAASEASPSLSFRVFVFVPSVVSLVRNVGSVPGASGSRVVRDAGRQDRWRTWRSVAGGGRGARGLFIVDFRDYQ